MVRIWFYQTAAAGALAFELFFLPLALVPDTRRWVMWVGLGLHFGTGVILGIWFWSLIGLYVVFFDWSRFDREHTEQREPYPDAVPVAVVGGLVVAMVVATVTFSPNSWPVAAYPALSGIKTTVAPEWLLVSGDETIPIQRSPLGEAIGTNHAIQMAFRLDETPLEGGLLLYASSFAGIEYERVELVAVSIVPPTREGPR